MLEASCLAYDLPFLFAYQIENPPTTLLLAEPAPNRAISLRCSKSIFRPKDADEARQIDAKADAENPSPFP
jgi:hypothetical protein